MVHGTALVWAGIFGFVASRLQRVTALCVAMALAVLGYAMFGILHDPIAKSATVAAMSLGIGQISAILSSQVLIGQEAPREICRSVPGAYGFFGAARILSVSGLGGFLFDQWRPGAPFLLMPVANAMLLIWALWVRQFAPGSPR